MRCKPWEIWWATVAYDDNPSKSTVRPVLIVDTEAMVAIALKLTTHAPRKGEFPLVDWSFSGLPEETTVRIGKVLKLTDSDIKNKIGRVSVRDRVKIENAFSL
jgi:hypothetical protein